MDNESVQKSVFRDEKTQKELNTPLADPDGSSGEDKKFFELVMQMINEGKIDLLNPETLINHAVYDKLSEEDQGKADFEAINLLASLRELKGLYDHGYADTYQMHNLIQRVRKTKERLEEKGGDLFII